MKEWRIAPQHVHKVRFKGSFNQHVLIDHAMEAYSIFAPGIAVLEITSANDGIHMDGSLHYRDKALDFRVWGVDAKQRFAIVTYLNYMYHPDEDWIDELDHIHGEYDPK